MCRRVVIWIQRISIALLVISAAAIGVEIFANDLENIKSMQIWAAVAIACLNVNAFAAIWKLWSSGTNKEKIIAIVLAVIIVIFWVIKLI